jgi:hypothetical protein
MGNIRIGLTISGAVSLGSFEGGALAALITGVQALQSRQPGKAPELRIDAIGAASAGAITAVAAARILTGGVDPVWVMEEAWVKEDSIKALLTNATTDAPLSMEGLTEMATRILSPDATRVDVRRVQYSDITIQLALANLRGLDYEIARLSTGANDRQPIEASTYLDWGEFTFKPNSDVSNFTQPPGRSPLDTSLASGSNEFGFPPKSLARSAADYSGQDLINFPVAAKIFWYTDGGTIDNEPLGRTLNLTNDIDSTASPDPIGPDDRRLHILIHPFPSAPPPATSLAWSDEQKKPTWVATLLRALAIIRAQNLYGDLRQAEKTNSRLIWSSRLGDAVAELIDGLSDDQKAAWQQRLQQVVDSIATDVGAMPRHRTEQARARPEPGERSGAADVFHLALERASGLAGKNPVGIEVVSPYLAQGTAGLALDQILAGEFLESFGGFFHEGLRRSDFALGFVCMLNWMEAGLESYGLGSDLSQIAIDEGLKAFFALEPWTEKGVTKGFTNYGLSAQLRERAASLNLESGPSWIPTDFGEMTLANLALGEKLELLNVGRRIGAVIGADAWLRATDADAQA